MKTRVGLSGVETILCRSPVRKTLDFNDGYGINDCLTKKKTESILEIFYFTQPEATTGRQSGTYTQVILNFWTGRRLTG